MTIHEQMSQQQIAGLSIAYIKDGELQKAECFWSIRGREN